MIIEKDAENEAKSILIELNTNKMGENGEWAFCKIMLDLKAFVLPLKYLGQPIVHALGIAVSTIIEM